MTNKNKLIMKSITELSNNYRLLKDKIHATFNELTQNSETIIIDEPILVSYYNNNYGEYHSGEIVEVKGNSIKLQGGIETEFSDLNMDDKVYLLDVINEKVK
jgi:hypothetical protein